MRRRFNERKFFMILLLAPALIALVAFIVMSLWNSILPAVIHVSTITFWQALGILLLSKILFGGFHGGGWRQRREQFRQRMFQKWQDMTPEEREKFKAQWKDRCGGRGQHWRRHMEDFGEMNKGQEQQPGPGTA